MASLLRLLRRPRLVALLLVAAHLGAALVPCPPPAEARAAADRSALHRAADADTQGRRSAHGAWCSGAPRAEWKAICPCGCGQRPEALASSIAGGLALISPPVPGAAAPGSAQALAAPVPVRPADAPAPRIEHVPLFA